MELVSQGRFRVAQVAWRKNAGDCFLTIACKISFQLAPGLSPVLGADEQEPIYEEDAFWNDDSNRSLSAASDLAPFKPRADILVLGHAFAPEGEPTRLFLARACVGEMDKSIDIWCDRGFALDGSLLEGARFRKMPLTWERAAGGPGTSNPVGMRFDARPNAYGVVPLPNLQPLGRLISQKGETFEPIGFGPIAPTWPGRLEKLHRYAQAWKHDRWFERPLPKDIDFAYFNAAPRDQQVESIRPNERLILEGLLAEHSRLVSNLEEVQPRVMVEFAGRAPEEAAMVCDTLTIDTDRALCMLVWRGHVLLRTLREPGRVVVSEALGDAFDATETFVSSADVAAGPVLPFAQEATPPSGRVTVDLPAHLLAKMNMPLSPSGETLRLGESAPPSRQVLPFGPAEEALLRKKSPEDTITEIRRGPVQELPFSAPMLVVPKLGEMGTLERGEEKVAEKAPEPIPELPAPPPMIGPLSRGEPEFLEIPAKLEPEPPALVVESEAPAEPEAPELSLEKCAELTASIARVKSDEGRILGENKLKAKVWEDAKAHWNEEIRKETARGKTGLLKRFDAAYVAQLEKERGPILVGEYARISVAMERGQVEPVLGELGLPRGSLMRIERVWAGRMAKDGVLEERVREAIEGEREGDGF